jgi:type I restriction enzyme R subunit
MGFTLNDKAAKPLLEPYHNGEGGRRYYQVAAIRAVLEKIARSARSGEPPRALLTLATGAGKTFIAVNLLKRIADAGQLKRALFVCAGTSCAPRLSAPSRTCSVPMPPR